MTHKLIPIAKAVHEVTRAHAILSASGSHIWLNCTPSARFGEEFPDEETEYSREGVWAHSTAGFRLEGFLGRPHAEYQTEEEIPGRKEFFNPSNDEAINAYVRRCIIAIAAARRETPDAIILMEQRLDFSDWVPEGFGTGDLVIVANGILRVRDLKFGMVQVDAEDNTQLWLYALGAIAAYRGIYDFDKVIVEIDQPRRNHLDGDRRVGAAVSGASCRVSVGGRRPVRAGRVVPLVPRPLRVQGAQDSAGRAGRCRVRGR